MLSDKSHSETSFGHDSIRQELVGTPTRFFMVLLAK